MLWHVCGTPGRLPVVTDPGRPKFGLLAWALMGAPSAIRTRDLLLRRHSPGVAGWGWMWPDVPLSCTGSGWTWLSVARDLPSLAPPLAPRHLVACLMFE